VSIERAYHCDGPDCEVHTRTATPPPYLPPGFLRVEEGAPDGREEYHFCTWDCAIRYGATRPPTETIAWDDVEGPSE